MNVLRRAFPAPWLSIAMFVLWLALVRSAEPAQLVLAGVIAIIVPLLTASLRLLHARLRSPGQIVRFILIVFFDVIASNLAVARDVLRWRWCRPKSRFVVIPLELRDPLGLAMLALVTTIVPGTVWSEISVDRSAMLLHVWHVEDEVAYVTRFKHRYERPLREIFD